jgi:hypothetical protein
MPTCFCDWSHQLLTPQKLVLVCFPTASSGSANCDDFLLQIRPEVISTAAFRLMMLSDRTLHLDFLRSFAALCLTPITNPATGAVARDQATVRGCHFTQMGSAPAPAGISFNGRCCYFVERFVPDHPFIN